MAIGSAAAGGTKMCTTGSEVPRPLGVLSSGVGGAGGSTTDTLSSATSVVFIVKQIRKLVIK